MLNFRVGPGEMCERVSAFQNVGAGAVEVLKTKGKRGKGGTVEGVLPCSEKGVMDGAEFGTGDTMAMSGLFGHTRVRVAVRMRESGGTRC